MKQVDVTVKMDEELVDQLDEFCENVGLSIETAVNIFAKKVVREHSIPFTITDYSEHSDMYDPFYSPENMAVLKESIAQLERGEGTLHEVRYDG